jgi:glycosyltransferase involved in cell wall biosynthesis
MRIAINVDGQFVSEPSGIHAYVDSLIPALASTMRGHELTAFAPSAPFDVDVATYGWTKDKRIRVDLGASNTRAQARLALRASRQFSSFARRVHPTFVSPIEALVLRRHIRSATKRFDILHIPSPNCRHYADSEARSLVATVYDMTPRFHPDTQRPEWIAAWGAYFEFVRNRCARVLTISEAAKRDIMDELSIPEDRIRVTPLAPRVGTKRMDPGPDRDRLLDQWGLSRMPFVLYAGTLEPRKNLPTLIRAFALAAHEMRHDPVSLVLAGAAWGDHARELAEVAKRHDVADRVVMTGYVGNNTLNALMSACEVFAYISYYEGFGLPPLEAMTCGAPVVVSNASSLPEVVGDAGIQVSPRDHDSLAHSICHLLSDSRERDSRRQASLVRSAQFSWRTTASLTLDCYLAAA